MLTKKAVGECSDNFLIHVQVHTCTCNSDSGCIQDFGLGGQIGNNYEGSLQIARGLFPIKIMAHSNLEYHIPCTLSEIRKLLNFEL